MAKERYGYKVFPIQVPTDNGENFHQVGDVLRKEIHMLGYSNDFVIYDQDDSKALVRGVIRDMELDEKTFVPKAVQGHISKYR